MCVFVCRYTALYVQQRTASLSKREAAELSRLEDDFEVHALMHVLARARAHICVRAYVSERVREKETDRVCVCVCVCVREGGSLCESARARERERERESLCVCVCLCVCV
jgi:hypothetical protein